MAQVKAKNISVERFVKKLKALRSPRELKKYHRYFEFDEDKPGKGDQFIGVRMGQVFALAKEFIAMPPDEIEKLLESPIHEVRAGGVSIMDKQSRSKKTTEARRKELYDLYMRRHDRINNWDLVDLGCLHMVGSYLFDKPRSVLYKLARSKNMWERRTAIVSTTYFMRQGEVDDTFKIAGMLLNDKDRQKLLLFLDKHAATMPRVALRYAIEHFDKKQRDQYLSVKKAVKLIK